MTRAGNVLVVVAMVMVMAMGGGVLVACSSDEAAAPGLPSAASSGVTATDSTVGSTASTSLPATAAPTTTEDPAVELATQVEADFLEADRLGREASQDPFNAEKEQAALDRLLGVSHERLRESLADYRTRNFALRPNLNVPASVTVERPAALIAPSEVVAELQICEVNSWLLVEVGAGPNGTDAIVNPDVIASRSTVFLRNLDGQWKVEGGKELARWEGIAECPAG